MTFQRDTALFRKAIKKNRNTMGYSLDVGGKTEPSASDVLDATSFISKHRQSISLGNTQSKDSQSADAILQNSPEHPPSSDQSPKDTAKTEVWGVGKSGANLSRILHAGHFALKLLPQEGMSRLVLITDGTMKSNIHDNTFVRQFAEKDITCHIIQIGNSHDFIPGKNFGFVPDSEILKFLARATSGTFMYSSRCLPVAGTSLAEKERAQLLSPSQAVQFNPNLYHHRILFRETTFIKTHSEARINSDIDSRNYLRREAGNELQSVFSNFPWDPHSTAPEEEWRLLKYREYVLPPEFSHIIAARARDGFIIQSVTFDDGTGSRQVDSDIHNLEAKNLSTMKKERVQIVMALHWQPNVIIEYRIRATWLPVVIGNSSSFNSEALLMSSGIFSRAKAPRAEIYVRTGTSFAHMLQNWDMFKRRAQMMGVVTGNIYFGETYAAPVYSKIEKLKKYLVDIYEGDEQLKSIIVFPSKFWNSISNATVLSPNPLVSPLWPTDQAIHGMAGKQMALNQQELFIQSFKAFWNRFNATETRTRTRCWYDSGCIDLLLGNVSPFMTPKLMSVYNQDFVSNVERNIQIAINNVKLIMEEWSDFIGEDGTFVKTIHRIPINATDDVSKEIYIQSGKQPPSFCELRVRHEYGRLITLRLLFFNVEVVTRRKVAENLVHLIESSPFLTASCNTVCRRSLSTLLLRDPKHFLDSSILSRDSANSTEGIKTSAKPQSRSKTWYLPFAMSLTGEHIVHNYLHHTTWSWQTDSHGDTYHKNNKMMPIHDLAFQFLCQARLDQGFELVSPRQDSTQFYQEMKLSTMGEKRKSIYSSTGKITTELWLEPTGEFDMTQYEHIKKSKISQLVTFDQIHTIGRSKVIGEFKDRAKNQPSIEEHEDNHNFMLLPQLFDVSSVLRSNKFVVASFACPKFGNISYFNQTKLRLTVPHHEDYDKPHGDGSNSNASTAPNTPNIRAKSFLRTQRHLRRNLSHNPSDFAINIPLPHEEQNMYTPRPDALLSNNIKNMVELDIALQSYAIHHYFVERSLEHISSGEINMTHHNLGVGFWNELKVALYGLTQDKKRSSTSLITDLRKTRCFVKIFDPRSFVIILYPNLDSVTNSLLKLQKENTVGTFLSESESSNYTDVFMFECIRQKPIRPAKDGQIFEKSDCFSDDTIVENTDPISIKPINFLIHESDGLGEMFRPSLYKGHFGSCQTNAQISEKTLRVAQDVVKHCSKSFFNSFYACLARGIIVNDCDLNKVTEVCHESSMEIDMTEFINMMSTQREDSIGFTGDVQAAEAQGKFNAIFNQYFELVHTKIGKKTNLFYYRPSFSRYSTAGFQPEDTLEDSKIAYIVNLASHSRNPLLVKLSYISRAIHSDSNTETDSMPDLVFPVSTLPTSYMELENAAEKRGAENGKGQTNFFLMPKDRQAVLQLVFLNMPKTELENSDMNSHEDIPTETVE
ncbi:hypothetical protein BY458DRAFT_531401 [Sporodiniella umbellata]|nr:hypothetical protein BY458DRAFT_531401 [Sporodiniella umbellata]